MKNFARWLAQRDLSEIIFSGRWFLAPMYLALIPAGLLYLYKYFRHLFDLIQTVGQLNDTELLLGVLHMLDMIMVGNLLVMIMIGGYSLFIRKLQIADESKRLTWLDHIDPATLKVKLGMALIGVSSIHLLESFIGSPDKSWIELSKLIVIHLVFVISTIGIALIGRKKS